MSLSSTHSGIEVTLTDLISMHIGRMENEVLRQQMDEYDPEVAVPLLHKDLEGKNSSGKSKFKIVEDENGPTRFIWELHGVPSYNVPCYPARDAAMRLRDGLLVPLLRASVAASRFLPPDTCWPPPPPDGGSQLLPDFASAGLCALLNRFQHAAQAQSQATGGSSSGGGTAASCGTASSAPSASVATVTAAAAANVTATLPSVARESCEEAERDERRRRAHEEREKKKQKTMIAKGGIA